MGKRGSGCSILVIYEELFKDHYSSDITCYGFENWYTPYDCTEDDYPKNKLKKYIFDTSN